MFKRYANLKYLKNPALRALLIGDALVLIAVAMLTPIYAIYVNEIGGDIFEVGITAAALAFGAGISSLVSGKYTDRLKNKKLPIIIGYFVIGVGFLLYTQVHSVLFLAIVQLIIGLVRPVYETAFDALYSIHLDKSKEAAEWGAWEAMSYFTAGIGAIVGGAFVANFGFKPLFIIMASMCFASALYIFKLPQKLL